MTRARNSWDRLLWAVKFRDPRGSFLVGSAWYRESNTVNKGYKGEPTRVLLFMTRQQARNVCREFHSSHRKIGGVCARWKFTPVRVREKVLPV